MKRNLIFALIMTGIMAVAAGCSIKGIQPDGPQQSVYAAGGQLAVAFVAADAYQSLPDCSANPPPCADATTSRRIQDAKVKALDAKKRVEAIVRDPNFDKGDYARAELILTQALNYLLTITPKVN